mmetsp:Transcript_26208/g.48006  ORF Transcript_26208/g.48006 Transcript_26208/m.48006 type:complete len:81 (+) Transcript_26208:156-398(+)
MPEFNKKWQDVPEMGFSVAPWSFKNAIQVSECRLGIKLLSKPRWRAKYLVLYHFIETVGVLQCCGDNHFNHKASTSTRDL